MHVYFAHLEREASLDSRYSSIFYTFKAGRNNSLISKTCIIKSLSKHYTPPTEFSQSIKYCLALNNLTMVDRP